jgi:uncharacterized protein YggT (Ycf19 family)
LLPPISGLDLAPMLVTIILIALWIALNGALASLDTVGARA